MTTSRTAAIASKWLSLQNLDHLPIFTSSFLERHVPRSIDFYSVRIVRRDRQHRGRCERLRSPFRIQRSIQTPPQYAPARLSLSGSPQIWNCTVLELLSPPPPRFSTSHWPWPRQSVAFVRIFAVV